MFEAGVEADPLCVGPVADGAPEQTLTPHTPSNKQMREGLAQAQKELLDVPAGARARGCSWQAWSHQESRAHRRGGRARPRKRLLQGGRL